MIVLGSRVFALFVFLLVFFSSIVFATAGQASYTSVVTFRPARTDALYATIDNVRFAVDTRVLQDGDSKNNNDFVCAGEDISVVPLSSNTVNYWGWNSRTGEVSCYFSNDRCRDTDRAYTAGAPLVTWISSSDYSNLVANDRSSSSLATEHDIYGYYMWDPIGAGEQSERGTFKADVLCYGSAKVYVDGGAADATYALPLSSPSYSTALTAGAHTIHSDLRIDDCALYTRAYLDRTDDMDVYWVYSRKTAGDVDAYTLTGNSMTVNAITASDGALLSSRTHSCTPSTIVAGSTVSFSDSIRLSNSGEIPADVSGIVLRDVPVAIGGRAPAALSFSASHSTTADVPGGGSHTYTTSAGATVSAPSGSIGTHDVYADVSYDDDVQNPCTATNPTQTLAVPLCTITVTAPPPEPAASCTLTPTSAPLYYAGTQTFTASCEDADGNSVNCPTLSWSLSGTGTRGTMSPTPTSAGASPSSTYTAPSSTVSPTLSVTSTDASQPFASPCTASITVTAPPVPLATSCVLSPATSTLEYGATQPFTATCMDSAGVTRNCPTMAWTLSLASGSGTISPTPTSAGASASSTYTAPSADASVTLSVNSNNAGVPFTAPCTAVITVRHTVGPAASCSLSPSSPTLYVGGTQAFTATCADSLGFAVTCSRLQWSANNGGTMGTACSTTASPSSTLTAPATPATITVTATQTTNGCSTLASPFSCTAAATVQNLPSCIVSHSPAGSLAVGVLSTFQAACRLSDGSTASCGAVSWTKSAGLSGAFENQHDPQVDFRASAVSSGTIQAGVTLSGIATTCSEAVSAVVPAPDACTLSQTTSGALHVGDTVSFAASCTGRGASVSCPALSWTVSTVASAMSPASTAAGASPSSSFVATASGSGTVTANSGSFSCTRTATISRHTCAVEGPSPIIARSPTFYSVVCRRVDGAVVPCNALSGSWAVSPAAAGSLSGASGASVTFIPPRDGLFTLSAQAVVPTTAPSETITCGVLAVRVNPVPVNSCVLTPSSVNGFVGDSISFTAACTTGGSSVDCPSLTWTSAIPATIAPNPSPSARSPSVSLTPTAAGMSAMLFGLGSGFPCSAILNVRDRPVCEVTGPSNVVLNDPTEYRVLCGYGSATGFCPPSLAWFSEGVAGSLSGTTNSRALFTASAIGSGRVGARVTLGGVPIECSAPITSSNVPVRECSVSITPPSVLVGGTATASISCIENGASVACPADFVYSSDVGSFAGSTFTGETAGDGTVVASSASFATCSTPVTVADAGVAASCRFVGVGDTAMMRLGDTRLFSVECLNAVDLEVSCPALSWSVSDFIASSGMNPATTSAATLPARPSSSMTADGSVGTAGLINVERSDSEPFAGCVLPVLLEAPGESVCLLRAEPSSVDVDNGAISLSAECISSSGEDIDCPQFDWDSGSLAGTFTFNPTPAANAPSTEFNPSGVGRETVTASGVLDSGEALECSTLVESIGGEPVAGACTAILPGDAVLYVGDSLHYRAFCLTDAGIAVSCPASLAWSSALGTFSSAGPRSTFTATTAGTGTVSASAGELVCPPVPVEVRTHVGTATVITLEVLPASHSYPEGTEEDAVTQGRVYYVDEDGTEIPIEGALVTVSIVGPDGGVHPGATDHTTTTNADGEYSISWDISEWGAGNYIVTATADPPPGFDSPTPAVDSFIINSGVSGRKCIVQVGSGRKNEEIKVEIRLEGFEPGEIDDSIDVMQVYTSLDCSHAVGPDHADTFECASTNDEESKGECKTFYCDYSRLDLLDEEFIISSRIYVRSIGDYVTCAATTGLCAPFV